MNLVKNTNKFILNETVFHNGRNLKITLIKIGKSPAFNPSFRYYTFEVEPIEKKQGTMFNRKTIVFCEQSMPTFGNVINHKFLN